MSGKRQELMRLLEVFRKGLIDEQTLLEQMGEIGLDVGDGSRDSGADEPGLLERLDAYRAAEASGAETLARWADLAVDQALAGGLRTAAAREAAHAELLAQRITELGGKPKATIPDWLAGYNAALLDPSATDADRLAAIIAQFPDVDAALDPLRRQVENLRQDDLTRELLRTIADDEAVTLRWFHGLHDKHERDDA